MHAHVHMSIYIYAMIGQFVGHAHVVHGLSTAEIEGTCIIYYDAYMVSKLN